MDEISKVSLLHNLRGLEESISRLDVKLIKLGKEDEDCKLMTTILGVEVITAMTYKSNIDDPSRCENSEDVGAYIALTRSMPLAKLIVMEVFPKMGSKFCRTALYEAAQNIICISKKQTKLKKWGTKFLKKKAIVAVARKLDVIMRRILVDGTETEFDF